MNKAGDYLVWYMRKAWEAAGLNWDGDNDAEVRIIIDIIDDEINRRIKKALQEK